MTKNNLLPCSKRICCVCGCEATGHLTKRIPGEPNVIAISFIVYRRGKGKGKLVAAKAVQVCQECLERALTGGRLTWMGGDKGGWKLWASIRESLLGRYSSMVHEDKE